MSLLGLLDSGVQDVTQTVTDSFTGHDVEGFGAGLINKFAGSDSRGFGVGLTNTALASDSQKESITVSKADTTLVSNLLGAGAGLNNAGTISNTLNERVNTTKIDTVPVSETKGFAAGLTTVVPINDTEKESVTVSKADTALVSNLLGVGAGVTNAGALSDTRKESINATKIDTALISELKGAGVGLINTALVSDARKQSATVAKIDTALVSELKGTGVGLVNAGTVSDVEKGSVGVTKIDAEPISDSRGYGVGLINTTLVSDPKFVFVKLVIPPDKATESDVRSYGAGLITVVPISETRNLNVKVSIPPDTAFVREQVDQGQPVFKFISDTMLGSDKLSGFGIGWIDPVVMPSTLVVKPFISLIERAIVTDPRSLLVAVKETDKASAGGDTITTAQQWVKMITDTVATTETYKFAVGLQNSVTVSDLRNVLVKLTEIETTPVKDPTTMQARPNMVDNFSGSARSVGVGVSLTNVATIHDLTVRVQNWLQTVTDNFKAPDRLVIALNELLRDTGLISDTVANNHDNNPIVQYADPAYIRELLTVLVRTVLVDTAIAPNLLGAGTGLINNASASDGPKGVAAGLVNAFKASDQKFVAPAVTLAADKVAISDLRTQQLQVLAHDAYAVSAPFTIDPRVLVPSDKVSAHDLKLLTGSVFVVPDKVIDTDSTVRSPGLTVRDRALSQDTISEQVQAKLADTLIIPPAGLRFAVALLDTLILAELQGRAARISVAEPFSIKDPIFARVLTQLTDKVSEHDVAARVAELQRLVQDSFNATDRLDRAVQALIQEAIALHDEASNDGVASSILFLKFTEEALRTHGFTRQSLRVTKFIDQTLSQVRGRKREDS